MSAFLADAGYWALIVFAFIQACCIPISSEITFGFAGVLAYEGHLNIVLVILIGALAELAGSTLAYGLGRIGGRGTVVRYRRYLLMTQRDVTRVEHFFDQRGAWAVAVARIIPLVRAFTGIVSGFMEVPFIPFVIFNVIGTLVWAAALSLIGYALGSDWERASARFSQATNVLTAVVLLALVGLIVHKWIQIRREKQAEAAQASGGRGPGGPPDDHRGEPTRGGQVHSGRHRAPSPRRRD